MKGFFRFIFTIQFWKHLAMACAIVFVVSFITLQALKIYTNHGQSITVPDLRGLSMEQVQTLLNENQLEYRVLDSAYQVGLAPMAVIDQTPVPSAKVKENRTIYLTINANSAPKKPIPEVMGISLKSASARLISRGFKVGEFIYKPHPFKNSVLELQMNGATLEAGLMLPQASVIDLVLGDGLSSELVPVPALEGQLIEDAEFLIKSHALNVGVIYYEDGLEDTANAVVKEQIPTYQEGAEVKMGTAVDLFIGKDPALAQ